MPSPFTGGGAQPIPELAPGPGGFKPEIFISTPVGEDGSGYLFDERVGQVEQALTGGGRAFAGSTVRRRGYVKTAPDSQSAKGKILIQYTNDEQNDMGESLRCPQGAIYRVYFEDEQMSEHQWDAFGDQVQGGGNNPAPSGGVQKRQANASGGCKRPVSSVSGSQTGSSAAASSGASNSAPASSATASSQADSSKADSSKADSSGAAPTRSAGTSGPATNSNTGPITATSSKGAAPSGPVSFSFNTSKALLWHVTNFHRSVYTIRWYKILPTALSLPNRQKPSNAAPDPM